MTRLLCLAAFLMACISQPAIAQTAATPPPPKSKKVLVFLTSEEVDAARLLPPPPVDGSPRAEAELKALRALIAAVPPARMAQARWDDVHESPEMLEPVLGAGFDMAALPATAALLATVQTDADVAASSAKKLFKRKRPWAVDAAIKTCDPDDKPLSSYPSGHATLGYALALTMANLLPDRAQALLARASDYAYSREICGAHFATDTQASEALATAMITELMRKPGFQAEAAAALGELQSRHMTAPATDKGSAQ